MDRYVVMAFWFVLALALLGTCLWLIWPQLKPAGAHLAAVPEQERERVEFEIYWLTYGNGDARAKLTAWASWKACAARARPITSPAEIWTAVFGIVGAWLLATQFHPAWGFGAFLASNLGGIKFSRGNRHWLLLAQQVFFLGSSLIGLWNWWLGPLLLG